MLGPLAYSAVRHLPEIISTAVGCCLLVYVALWMLRLERVRSSTGRRRAVLLFLVLGVVLLLSGLAMRSGRISGRLPPILPFYLGSSATLLLLLLPAFVLAGLILRLLSKAEAHNPRRRRLLLAARGAVLAAPLATAGYAVFIQRRDFTTREVSLGIAGLPKELHGLRLVQMSDIHLSPYLSERDLAYAVDMANELRPHLALVTGDLITSARDPLHQCIRQLARLKADAGAIGCMGNHEVYARVLEDAEQLGASVGIEFLRSKSRVFTFGGKPINFAGVDYQRMQTKYLAGAEKLVRPGMPNVLLSHNPDVFPVAAEQGYDCTISGHTHGGQISMEILHQNVSIARFYTPYVYGVYRKGNSSIYVTRGIGTVGVPARLGAPPEVALIRLCAI